MAGPGGISLRCQHLEYERNGYKSEVKKEYVSKFQTSQDNTVRPCPKRQIQKQKKKIFCKLHLIMWACVCVSMHARMYACVYQGVGEVIWRSEDNLNCVSPSILWTLHIKPRQLGLGVSTFISWAIFPNQKYLLINCEFYFNHLSKQRLSLLQVL